MLVDVGQQRGEIHRPLDHQQVVRDLEEADRLTLLQPKNLTYFIFFKYPIKIVFNKHQLGKNMRPSDLLDVDRLCEGPEAAVQTQTLSDVTQEEAELSQHILLLLLQTEALLL